MNVLANDLRQSSRIPQGEERMVNLQGVQSGQGGQSTPDIPLGLRGEAGHFTGNLTARNVPTGERLTSGPSYPQLQRGPLRRDPQRAGQLVRDTMVGQRGTNAAWNTTGTRRDTTFLRRAGMTGLLLGGVEPTRLPSSFIPNLMAAYLGAQGREDLPAMLPDLPMSGSGRMAHGRELEFTLGARRILGQPSATSAMPRVAPTLLTSPIPGVTSPEVRNLHRLATGLAVTNAEVRRILGVDMNRGSPEETWRAVQTRAARGGMNPGLSTNAEALVRQKVAVVRAWANQQNLSFKDQRTLEEKQEEFLGKIWKWLLAELHLTDDGTGFITP
jgi:hypothetical protein